MPDNHSGRSPGATNPRRSHSVHGSDLESDEVNLRFARHGLVGEFATGFEVSTVIPALKGDGKCSYPKGEQQ